jgi:3'-5' exoribonuclease
MKTFINQFGINETISTYFLVKSKEFRNKKAGGQYLTLNLADCTGEIAAHWWDNFEEAADTFEVDDIVFARGQIILHRNRPQLTVHKVRAVNENEYELSDFFAASKFNVDEMFAELLSIIQGFENKFLKQLLENIFASEETVRKFKRAPAAKTMHHPFLGGLLEHSLSLVKLARKVGTHYEGIDLDLLQTGAVLHDFGKIDELSYERGTNYTNDGQMLGHLAMETIFVSEQIGIIPEFPEDLRRHLLHMLLSHHGKLEYGSPKLPSTPEAFLLSYLDDLDSKVEAMQRLIAEPNNTGDWTRITPMFERPIYRRRTMPSAEPEINSDPAVSVSTEASAPKIARTAAKNSGFNNPFSGLADLMTPQDSKE